MNATAMQTGKQHVISVQLVAHYDAHARILPWRVPPKSDKKPDPYRVWLSEIMLQQTTIAAVTPYYQRFTARWPTVSALAGADDADVMAAWAGLGYYSRARNLLACARAIVAEHGGLFPQTAVQLKTLPGIGDYTSAAIASIAFREAAAVVDGNVERVIARVFAISTPMPAAKAEVKARLAPLVPAERPGDFAQALMDLGATICTPRKPDCRRCPISDHCAAFTAGETELFPAKQPKRPRPTRTGIGLWIERDATVLLVQRPPKGLLGGMRALPDDGWSARADGTGAPGPASHWRKHAEIRHIFTHFDLRLALMHYCGSDWGHIEAANPGGIWWPVDQLDQAGLPSVFQKAADAARQGVLE